MNARFKIVGRITNVETIASGRGIRTLKSLKTRFGGSRWLKKKGIASIELDGGRIRKAELHWYECHGVGKVQMKIKAYVD